MTPIHLLHAAVAGLVCAIAPGAAWADPGPRLVLRDGPRILDTLPVEMYAPHFPSDGDSSESWVYTLVFDGGYAITVQFQVTNLGPGDGTALVLARYVTPDVPLTVTKNSRKRQDWSATQSSSGVALELADHSLLLGHPRYNLHLKHSQGAADLAIVATTPPFRLGKIDYGGGLYHDVTLLAPRLTASGELRMPGHPPVKLTGGQGTLVHTLSNIADRNRAIASLQLDTFDQPTQLTLIELTAPALHDFQRIGVLLLFQDGKLKQYSADLTREYEDYLRDPEQPHYPVPTRIRLASTDAGWSVRGRAELARTQREDILDYVNAGVARWFAKREVKARPIAYRLGARYELDVDLGDGPTRVSGLGHATVTIVNDPPTSF